MIMHASDRLLVCRVPIWRVLIAAVISLGFSQNVLADNHQQQELEKLKGSRFNFCSRY